MHGRYVPDSIASLSLNRDRLLSAQVESESTSVRNNVPRLHESPSCGSLDCEVNRTSTRRRPAGDQYLALAELVDGLFRRVLPSCHARSSVIRMPDYQPGIGSLQKGGHASARGITRRGSEPEPRLDREEPDGLVTPRGSDEATRVEL